MRISNVVTSNDNTKKYYFEVSEQCETHVEACLLYLQRYGYIICVSSQIGCPQKCKFCAAGSSEFKRNLSSDEIQEQVRMIVEDNPQMMDESFQVTYMGSGEPLSNYENVFDSIDQLRLKYRNLNKVNLSTTCPEAAEKCFEEVEWSKYRDFLHLQYSLHFTTDEERKKFICPKQLKISRAIEALNQISTEINDVYKINYVLFDNVNDGQECIVKLARIIEMTQGAVLKISQMCEVNKAELMPSTRFAEFVACAREAVKNVEVFCSDGTDVNAGCGQFYNESII